MGTAGNDSFKSREKMEGKDETHNDVAIRAYQAGRSQRECKDCSKKMEEVSSKEAIESGKREGRLLGRGMGRY